MFQSLRQNNQIYILHKGAPPTLETGTVVDVTPPSPKYPTPQMFGQPQEMVVDILVRTTGGDIRYQKVPATADIADFGNDGVVLSDSREAINAEVVSLKNEHQLELSEDRQALHRNIVAGCDSILQTLNPEYAERQARQAEIAEMKEQIALILSKLDSVTSPVIKKKTE